MLTEKVKKAAFLVLLCFALLCFTEAAFFNKLKVWDDPTPSKSPGVTFPTTFAHFTSVSFCTFDHADDTSTIEKLLLFLSLMDTQILLRCKSVHLG